ncbi:MAG: PAS domain-containing hybrid sensor histidine kinase/response regulator [Candidatus Kariarchaeaceae archaeon]|jgi:PAS domain S-box-containing protein
MSKKISPLSIEILNEAIGDIYRFMIDHAPNTIVIIDVHGSFVYANQIFFTYTGYSLQKIGNANLFDFIHPDDLPHVLSHFKLVLSGNMVEDLEYRLKINDGSYLNLLTDAVPIRENDEVIAIITMTQDLTERIRDKIRLEESEELHRTIIDLSPNAIIVHSEGKLKLINNKGLELIGASNFDELRNIPISKFVHPDYHEIVKKRIKAVQEEKQTIEPLQEKFITLDGSEIDVEVVGKPIQFEGRTASLLIIKDIGKDLEKQRKKEQAEKDLKQSEKRKSAIIDAIPDLIFLIDDGGMIFDFNAPDIDDLYIPAPDVIGSNIFEILPNDIGIQIKEKMREVRETEEACMLEYQLQLPNGLQDFEARFVVIGKNELLVIIRNITERKKVEEEHSRMLQIETIGLLAGGIAHDFNNILVGVLGNINLMQMDKGIPGSMRKSLNEMEKATLRASELTNQLLTFSKGGEPVTRPESIEDIIEDAISFIMHGSKSKCITEFQPNLPPVEVEAGQIYQLMHNLIINADQSMSDGGIIQIKVHVEKVSSKSDLPLQEGRYIAISIQDEGSGIPDNIKEKIFEPYFTTKKTGSGLGLPTSYSIVKRHHGHMKIESEVDRGSTFTIYLPVSTQETTIKEIQVDNNIELQGKILIMDDDPTIRQTLNKMLDQLKLRSEVARDGAEAITKYRKALNNEPFSLVIMDLTISGGIGGKEAITQLLQIDPNVVAIVSSGYSNDPVMANYLEFGFKGVLVKPYTLDQLRKVLVETLLPFKS